MKKRTLRSKVKKVIDEIPVECDKLEKVESKNKDVNERYKILQNEKFLNLLSNKKEFEKKNSIFQSRIPCNTFRTLKN